MVNLIVAFGRLTMTIDIEPILFGGRLAVSLVSMLEPARLHLRLQAESEHFSARS
jgi:hypothetical protein